METLSSSNVDQAERWNGGRGDVWSAQQQLLDQVFRPYEDLLIDQAVIRAGRPGPNVLDVGCGAGATTLALARQFSSTGGFVGVDLSEQLVDLARDRAHRERLRAHFIRDDAQVHAFPAGFFDLVVSRFGVMFFDDPVAAFTNLRQATGENGELIFFAWRSPEDNPFAIIAEKVAEPMLPELRASLSGQPGRFALADTDRIQEILAAGGWHDVTVQPIDIVCELPRQDLMAYLSTMGSVGRALSTVDQATRAKVLDAIRLAYEPFIDGDGVRYPTACWMVSARNRAPRDVGAVAWRGR